MRILIVLTIFTMVSSVMSSKDEKCDKEAEKVKEVALKIIDYAKDIMETIDNFVKNVDSCQTDDKNTAADQLKAKIIKALPDFIMKLVNIHLELIVSSDRSPSSAPFLNQDKSKRANDTKVKHEHQDVMVTGDAPKASGQEDYPYFVRQANVIEDEQLLSPGQKYLPVGTEVYNVTVYSSRFALAYLEDGNPVFFDPNIIKIIDF